MSDTFLYRHLVLARHMAAGQTRCRTSLHLAQGDIEGVRNESRRKRGEAAVWQRRYWEHCIRDDRNLSRHIDYIHFNPVKHGYVTKAVDWEYWTFHKSVKMGYYSAAWGSIEPDDLPEMPLLGE